MSSFSMPFGIQRLNDQNQRIFTNGTPVYYVTDNFNLSDNAFTELGLTFVPSDPTIAGTTQVLIDPPPDTSALSLTAIASASAIGMNLNLGSRKFTVSQTWVSAIQAAKGYADPRQVFEDDSVEGFLYDNSLYNIKYAVPNDGLGGTISWDVFCNAPDSN